jgi:uncharacterized protein (TIGR03000 family)
MYSLVMLAALTPGADAPAPAPGTAVVTGCYGAAPAGCTGYAGCQGSGSCYGSCHGSCYGSCFGSGRGSCHGGGIFGHRNGGGIFGHRNSCHGCTGYSCSGYNCFGSCHGAGVGSCHGGGCTGAGCTGCYGGGVSLAPVVGGPAVVGYGPAVSYTDPIAVYGRVTNINPIPVVVQEGPKPMAEPKKLGASIKFQLPEAAKLYVDGKLTLITGAERAFTTPPLEVGEKFFYDVKAELVVDGKPVVEAKRVVVEAGADLTESFPTLIAAAKANAVAGK